MNNSRHHDDDALDALDALDLASDGDDSGDDALEDDDPSRPDTGSDAELVSQPFGATLADVEAAAGQGQGHPTSATHDGDAARPGPWDDLDELTLLQNHPIDALVAHVQADAPRRAKLTGIPGGLKAPVLAQLQARTDRRVVIITPTSATGRTLAADLALFADPDSPRDVLFFPPDDTSPYSDIAPDRQQTLERLSAVFSLHMEIGARWVIVPAPSLLRKTTPADVLLEHAEVLQVGMGEITNARLRGFLTAGGYAAVSLVEDPGTFAIRGDIVDLWSPFDEAPVRIERWGDEVTALKTFDPATQRTLAPLSETYIFPVREAIFTDDTLQHARTALIAQAERQELDPRLVRQHLSDLEAGIHVLGIESLLPAFYPSLDTLADLIGDDDLVVLDDPDGCVESFERLFAKRSLERTRRLEANDAFAFDVASHYLTPAQARAWLHARPRRLTLQRANVLDDPSTDPSGLAYASIDPARRATFEFRARSCADLARLRATEGSAEKTVAAIGQPGGLLDRWRDLYGRVVVACDTAGEAQRLRQILATSDLDAREAVAPIDLSAPPAPPFDAIEVIASPYSEGVRSPALGLVMISGRELFGHRIQRRTRRTQSFQEASGLGSFKELKAGDYVVHTDFGIGRYGGLLRMEAGGIPGDFLQIEFADSNKLYLPVYRLERIQRYTGADASPRLDKLGSNAWERTKDKVRADLKELAFDLIALYARRQTQRGLAFDPPDSLYRQFEEAFPFEETPDQHQAIEATLTDLQQPRITDRLICGDVGFGKTEVAMRAAFLAALSSKQVAVLVPTTVLAEQHLATFRKRMEGFPVRVEALSRFRTRAQTRQIVKDTEAGRVDILIGTHRLLSKDVTFRNLGLMIVDEEQRFGVTHKEKIKAQRAHVDCITLSATPIPRTLQMSLLGIRDMSIIATPPPGRLAVRTHIARFGDNVIREAVERELKRGGQVYIVHNRVQTITELASHLRELIPEARIAVGHGQMKESELEKVMVGFVKRDFNVLLATTIIESGLDIPNANTMIIDRAEHFGLSQLYQLRGRIGRSKTRAYCYLLVRARRLTDIAQQRLDVIERFTDLGSGFHVASYDLEIRGAGNILGPEQSGNVAAVGLDLYTELLEEAIAEVRGEEVEAVKEPEVNIPVPAFIPEGYIHDTSLRLLFYKRLSLARSEDELDDLYTELDDRFGPPPEEVGALKEIIAVKIALHTLQCERLDAGTGVIIVHLGAQPMITPDEVIALIHAHQGRYTLSPDMKLTRRLHPVEAANPVQAARRVCRELLDAADLA